MIPHKERLMKLTLLVFALVGFFALQDFLPGNARVSASFQTQLTVTAANKLKIARQGETMELAA